MTLNKYIVVLGRNLRTLVATQAHQTKKKKGWRKYNLGNNSFIPTARIRVSKKPPLQPPWGTIYTLP